MHETPIRVSGEILRILKPELCEIRLPNGKITLGHLSRELKRANTQLTCGAIAELEMTPFDFDSGRIAGIRDPQKNPPC